MLTIVKVTIVQNYLIDTTQKISLLIVNAHPGNARQMRSATFAQTKGKMACRIPNGKY
jgi:hypothetical protein